MARYQMDDGTVINTENAVESWTEETRWNGSNYISVATGSQWIHQTLYKSRKGRYYIETTSQWQGQMPRCEWVSREEAARWLLANSIELPADLADLAEQIEE